MGKISNSRKNKRNAKKQRQRATKTLHKRNFPARKILQDSSLQQKGWGDNVLSDIEMPSTSTVAKMDVSGNKDLDHFDVEMSSQQQVHVSSSSSVDENSLPKKRVVKPRRGLQQKVMVDDVSPSTSFGKIEHYGVCVFDDSGAGSSHTQVKESKMEISLISSSSTVDEHALPEKQIVKPAQEVTVEEERRSTRRRTIVRDCARKQVVDYVTRQQTTDEDEHSSMHKKKKVTKRSCTPKTAKKLNRKTKAQGDHTTSSTSKQLSESETDTSIIESREDFKRYGVHVPTFQEMMAYRKECEKMDKEVEFMNAAIAEPILKLPEEPQKEPVPILDCKHLTEDQLEILLEQNYLFVHDIFHGIAKSERHDRYKATKFHRITFSKSNLIYNTSMIVFSYEQKQMMLKYLYSKFDNEGEFHTQTDYFFKVLLPELCTKIFMDTYQMTKEEAESYLAVRPAGK